LKIVLEKQPSRIFIYNNYSPNKRVLADIQKKEWIFVSINDSSKIKKTNIINNFKVDFSKSNVELDSCRIYIVESKNQEDKLYYKIENCSRKATFKNLYL